MCTNHMKYTIYKAKLKHNRTTHIEQKHELVCIDSWINQEICVMITLHSNIKRWH